MLKKIFNEIYVHIEQKTHDKAIELLGDKKLNQISINHFNYLETIKILGNPTLSQIANELKITKASVSTMISKLIGQGYVKKIQSHEDKRIFYIQLTNLGEQVLSLELSTFNQFGKQLMEVLSEKDIRELERILEHGLKLIKNNE